MDIERVLPIMEKSKPHLQQTALLGDTPDKGRKCSQALQHVCSKLPLPLLPQPFPINLLQSLPDRQRSPHPSPIHKHNPIPPHRNLKPNLRTQQLKQHNAPLRTQHAPRHAQTHAEQHPALQQAQTLAFPCRWVYTGELCGEVFAAAHDAAVDEGVREELGPRLFRGTFEGEVWERGGGRVRGEEALEGFGGGGVDGCYDEVAWEGCVLRVLM